MTKVGLVINNTRHFPSGLRGASAGGRVPPGFWWLRVRRSTHLQLAATLLALAFPVAADKQRAGDACDITVQIWTCQSGRPEPD